MNDEENNVSPLGFPRPEDLYNESERELDRLESAWAKAALYFRTGMHFGHMPDQICFLGAVAIHGSLDVWRRRFEAGDTLALLHAINDCAKVNMPLPTWLSIGFREAISKFLAISGDAENSLDDVFRSPSLHGKSKRPSTSKKKVAQWKQDWALGVQLLGAAWDAAQSDGSLSSIDAVVDTLLKNHPWGVKKTKAKTLINMVDKNQVEHLKGLGSRYQGLSQFLRKRRKS